MIQLLTNGLILEFLSVQLICSHTEKDRAERKEVGRGREYEGQIKGNRTKQQIKITNVTEERKRTVRLC